MSPGIYRHNTQINSLLHNFLDISKIVKSTESTSRAFLYKFRLFEAVSSSELLTNQWPLHKTVECNYSSMA